MISPAHIFPTGQESIQIPGPNQQAKAVIILKKSAKAVPLCLCRVPKYWTFYCTSVFACQCTRLLVWSCKLRVRVLPCSELACTGRCRLQVQIQQAGKNLRLLPSYLLFCSDLKMNNSTDLKVERQKLPGKIASCQTRCTSGFILNRSLILSSNIHPNPRIVQS